MSRILLSAEESKTVQDILNGDMSDPVALMRNAGCDVSIFFEYGDWRGMDFTGSDTTGISFCGADLTDALMTEEQANTATLSKARGSPRIAVSEPTSRKAGQSNGSREANPRKKELTENSKSPVRPRSEVIAITQERWERVRQRTIKIVGQNNYTTWIEPLQFRDQQNDTAVFYVPTKFFGNYLHQNFSDIILHELRRDDNEIRRVDFEVKPPKKSTQTPAAVGSSSSAPLEPRYTFENFVVSKPNELAYAAAKRVAEGGPATFNPLYIYGSVGLGSTHLMHAIAWELQSRNPNTNVLYLPSVQFIDRFVQSMGDRKLTELREAFRSVDVLLFDDIQFLAGEDSRQDEFFQVFKGLLDQNKQIVISADCPPSNINDLDERLKSGLQSGLVVNLSPTDYELRLQILQANVKLQRVNYPDVMMDDGVLEFLAHRISSNVRVLEGALTRLWAFCSLVGRSITIEIAQECLADILRSSVRKVTVEEIQREVSSYYNIRLSDLIGPRRLRAYARPRQVAMYIAKHITSRSLPELGRLFGGRDHTAVIHATRRIGELRKADVQIEEDLKILLLRFEVQTPQE